VPLLHVNQVQQLFDAGKQAPPADAQTGVQVHSCGPRMRHSLPSQQRGGICPGIIVTKKTESPEAQHWHAIASSGCPHR
jgi:hypothetical protein